MLPGKFLNLWPLDDYNNEIEVHGLDMSTVLREFGNLNTFCKDDHTPSLELAPKETQKQNQPMSGRHHGILSEQKLPVER